MDNCKDEHMPEESILTADLGKFESVYALLCAYENLEKEFTRKSQRLAELEKSKDNSDNCNETGSEQPEETEEKRAGGRIAASRKGDEAHGAGSAIPNEIPAKSQIETKAGKNEKPEPQEVSEEELIEIALQSERVRDKIISDYLQGLAANNGVRILSGRIGATALTPVERPRTLREAKAIADRMMRG